MAGVPQDRIRNFCIIAHVDHGKSTLADRLLEVTNTVEKRDMQEQLLDQMDIERERGITIKMAAVRMPYRRDDGQEYELNLIDTPGHVDFTYEVSRSLNACEGALLVIDAAQGVEAQTLANANLAMNSNLEIIPVINKIDLPAADPDRVAEEIENVLAIDATDAIRASAKEGIGVKDILEAVVKTIPPPKGDPEKPLRALVFDSHYDAFLGVVAYVRVVDGSVKVGDQIKLIATGKTFTVDGVGVFTPRMKAADAIHTGSTGYVHAAIKSVTDCRVGDTMTLPAARAQTFKPCPATSPPNRWSFAACTRLTPTSSLTCARRLPRCSSTTPRSRSSPNRRPRSALAFGAAFWACSTWRSSRSGWSASST
jgi:GTP-binding protein LepA